MLNPTVAVLVDGCAIHFPVELEPLQRKDCIARLVSVPNDAESHSGDGVMDNNGDSSFIK